MTIFHREIRQEFLLIGIALGAASIFEKVILSEFLTARPVNRDSLRRLRPFDRHDSPPPRTTPSAPRPAL